MGSYCNSVIADMIFDQKYLSFLYFFMAMQILGINFKHSDLGLAVKILLFYVLAMFIFLPTLKIKIK